MTHGRHSVRYLIVCAIGIHAGFSGVSATVKSRRGGSRRSGLRYRQFNRPGCWSYRFIFTRRTFTPTRLTID